MILAIAVPIMVQNGITNFVSMNERRCHSKSADYGI